MITQALSALPADTTAAFLALGVAFVVAAARCAWLKSKQGLLLPLSVFVASAAPLVSASIGIPLLLGAGFLMWRALRVPSAGEAAQPLAGSKVTIVACTLFLLALSVTLAYRLGSFTSESLTWETSTIDGIAEDLSSERSLPSLAKEKLLWNSGVLTASPKSLLYGFPVLVLFKYVSASIVAMRAVALVYFIGACAIFAIFLGRRWGAAAACAGLTVIALSEPSLLYARYGVSVSATLFALAAALALCSASVSTLRLSLVVLAPVALFAATLGYSPGRIPAAVLALCTFVGLLTARSFGLTRRLVSAGVFAALLSAIIFYQSSNHRSDDLFSGRGEQIFGMSQSSWFPAPMLSMRSLRVKSPAPFLPGEKVGLAIELVRQVTAHQLALALSPFASTPRGPDGVIRIQTDPPYWRVMPPVLVPFVLLGFLQLLRLRKFWWLQTALVGWVAASCACLLLTNRVDTHRAYFLIVPVAIWAAVGLDRLYRSLSRWIPPAILAGSAVAGVALFAVFPRASWLYAGQFNEPPAVTAFKDLLRQVPGPVTVAESLPHQQSSWLRLAILERTRTSGQQSAWLSPSEMNDLTRNAASPDAKEILALSRFIADGGVFVASPPQSFFPLAAALEHHEAQARRTQSERRDFLLVSRKPSPELDSFAPVTALPTLPTSPAPDAARLRAVPVSSIRPDEVVPCSAKVGTNSSVHGGPLRVGGAEYASGISLQANTAVRIPVPPGSRMFKALAGINDAVLPCQEASAEVRVLDRDGRVLFHSPTLKAGRQPVELLVDLRDDRQLTIEVNGAGDGTKCDLVDLANAVFLLDPNAPAPPAETVACVCPKDG